MLLQSIRRSMVQHDGMLETTRPLLLSTSAMPSSSLTRLGSSTQIRLAHKRGGGSTKNLGGSGGQRLGIKRQQGQFVRPGEIIFKQRGTIWHPGYGAKRARDHSIYAAQPGWVRYYQPLPHPDPHRNIYEGTHNAVVEAKRKNHLAISPTTRQTVVPIMETVKRHPSSNLRRFGRKYIGVVLHPTDVLPRLANAPRIRRLDRFDEKRLSELMEKQHIDADEVANSARFSSQTNVEEMTQQEVESDLSQVEPPLDSSSTVAKEL